MSFLPDVKVLCDGCNGERFNRDTLGVTWRGKNAGEVLKMEVDEAVEFFAAHSRIPRILQLMQDVALGYLTLGQPSPTPSGGEAQRIKLVAELAQARLTERSEEHTSDLQSLMRISYAVVSLNKKKKIT